MSWSLGVNIRLRLTIYTFDSNIIKCPAAVMLLFFLCAFVGGRVAPRPEPLSALGRGNPPAPPGVIATRYASRLHHFRQGQPADTKVMIISAGWPQTETEPPLQKEFGNNAAAESPFGRPVKPSPFPVHSLVRDQRR